MIQGHQYTVTHLKENRFNDKLIFRAQVRHFLQSDSLDGSLLASTGESVCQKSEELKTRRDKPTYRSLSLDTAEITIVNDGDAIKQQTGCCTSVAEKRSKTIRVPQNYIMKNHLGFNRYKFLLEVRNQVEINEIEFVNATSSDYKF